MRQVRPDVALPQDRCAFGGWRSRGCDACGGFVDGGGQGADFGPAGQSFDLAAGGRLQDDCGEPSHPKPLAGLGISVCVKRHAHAATRPLDHLRVGQDPLGEPRTPPAPAGPADDHQRLAGGCCSLKAGAVALDILDRGRGIMVDDLSITFVGRREQATRIDLH